MSGISRRAIPLLLVVAVALAAPAVALAQTAPAPAPPAPVSRAHLLVDANTGSILEAKNAREALPAASLTKLLTALAVIAHLPPDATVPVSARAAGMPAHKISMKAGEVWDLEDTLHALLLSSANDAGMALAERVAGSGEAFAANLARTARRLRLADSPVLVDPSGLDDEFSVGGGNKISARDLAIVARAVLAEPRLAAIVANPVYRFTGPDGIPHRLGNHNQLLKRYAGAVGLKTGYTKRSGRCLIAAATRAGRTMIAVILAGGDTYGFAAGLLDKGFATPPAGQPPTGRLPALPEPLPASGPVPQVATEPEAVPVIAAESSLIPDVLGFALRALVGFGVVLIGFRLRARHLLARRAGRRRKHYRVPPPSRRDPGGEQPRSFSRR